MNSAPGTVQRFNHPQLGTVNYRVDVVSDDPDTQVEQVIGMMDGLAVEDSKSPEIAQDVANIREWMRQSGVSDPVEAVYHHVKGRMTFVRDESTALPLQAQYGYPIVECLTRPKDISVSRGPQGDCDDFAMYGASILLALGVPVSFVTVAADPAVPGVYSHVYLAAYPSGRRVPLDLSHGPGAGWETEHYSRRTEWPVGGGSGWLVFAGLAALALCVRRN